MIDRVHVLETLFGRKNALWQRETQHEAMLLMRALYTNDVEAREKIVTAVLEGPPQELLSGEVEHEAERELFEMLSFLESSEHVVLPAEAQKILSTLRGTHPEWRPRPYPGLSIWIEPGSVRKEVGVDEINSIKPADLPEKIVGFQETGKHLAVNFARQLGSDLARSGLGAASTGRVGGQGRRIASRRDESDPLGHSGDTN